MISVIIRFYGPHDMIIIIMYLHTVRCGHSMTLTLLRHADVTVTSHVPQSKSDVNKNQKQLKDLDTSAQNWEFESG